MLAQIVQTQQQSNPVYAIPFYHKLLRGGLQIMLQFLSWIVPKKRKLWLFFPIHYRKNKLEGNIKSLFAYVYANEPDIDACCIGLDEQQIQTNSQFSGKLFKGKYTLLNIWLILRAEIVIVDSGWHQKGNFRVVQLWHGTGFKNIGVMQHIDNGDLKKIQRAAQASKNLFFVVASSEDDMKRKKQSFLTANVYVTGSPRNDELFVQHSDIRGKLGLPLDRKLVCYVPTFRDIGNFNPFTEEFWVKLDILADKCGFVFVIKEHPHVKNRLQIPPDSRNIVDVTDLAKDVQELLIVSDVLISDYSGIVSDFALLGRPIIFYVYDFDEYLSTCRDFYYDLEITLPGPFAYTETELLRYIDDMTWFDDEDYQLRFAEFCNKFQKYRDGNSSRRVVEQLRRLLYG